jgi:hypothetical protein
VGGKVCLLAERFLLKASTRENEPTILPVWA